MIRGNLAIQNPNYVKKLQLKQIFCCETRVRGKLVASPSPSYRQYIHQIAGFCSITSLVAYNT